jgi:hypothetical protein
VVVKLAIAEVAQTPVVAGLVVVEKAAHLHTKTILLLFLEIPTQ